VIPPTFIGNPHQSNPWVPHICPALADVGLRVPYPCRRFLSTGWVSALSSPDRHVTRSPGAPHLPDVGRWVIAKGSRVPHPCRRFLSTGWVPQLSSPDRLVTRSPGAPYLPDVGRWVIAKGSRAPHPCRRFLSTGWVPQLSSPDRLVTRSPGAPHLPAVGRCGTPPTFIGNPNQPIPGCPISARFWQMWDFGCPIQARFWLEWDSTNLKLKYRTVGAPYLPGFGRWVIPPSLSETARRSPVPIRLPTESRLSPCAKRVVRSTTTVEAPGFNPANRQPERSGLQARLFDRATTPLPKRPATCPPRQTPSQDFLKSPLVKTSRLAAPDPDQRSDPANWLFVKSST